MGADIPTHLMRRRLLPFLGRQKVCNRLQFGSCRASNPDARQNADGCGLNACRISVDRRGARSIDSWRPETFPFPLCSARPICKPAKTGARWKACGLPDVVNVERPADVRRPNISGSLFVGTVQCSGTPPDASGAFTQTSQTGVVGANWSGNLARVYSLSATRSTSIYGKSSTLQPPSLRLLPCIKA